MRKIFFPGLMIFFIVCMLGGCQREKDRIIKDKIAEYQEYQIEESKKEEKQNQNEESHPVIEVTTRAEEREKRENLESQEETGEEEENSSKISLLFGGDVLLSDHVLNAYQRTGGIQGVLDEGYRKLIEDSSFFMVNQEFPFSDRGVQAEDKQFTFRLPTEKVSIFREMGIDGVTLANNHALDFGQDALLDSIAVLDQAGILHTGAGENLEKASVPVTAEIQGMKIAVIGATRVIPVAGWAAGNSHPGMLATYDPAVLLAKIKELRQGCDYVIVYVHWGTEREESPEDYQRSLGHQYIDAGADMVIGSHPHVLQGIEYYNGKPIVYSLGNFVFGSSIPKTMLLEVKILPGKESQPVLRIFPGTSGAGFTKMLTDENKQQEFYRYMENISFGITFLSDGTVVYEKE